MNQYLYQIINKNKNYKLIFYINIILDIKFLRNKKNIFIILYNFYILFYY